MSDYDQEKWVDVYITAVMELEHAAMTGRIGDARIAISTRLEKLKHLPGLHAREHQAIEDALNNLRVWNGKRSVLRREKRSVPWTKPCKKSDPWLQGFSGLNNKCEFH